MIDLISIVTFIKSIGLTGIIIALVVYYIARFYTNRYNYPPGPFPLPLIGNVLEFRKYKRHWSEEIVHFKNKYGPVFTLWIGPLPFVIICDLDIARVSFNKVEFSGRPAMPLANIFCNEKHKDVLLNDYGKCWESLRRVAHKAVRNYAKTQALSEVVANNVRQMVDSIITTEGIGKPFPAKLYAYNLFANILGSVVFSEKFDIEQPELKKFKYITTDFQTDLGSSMFVYEFIPIARYFMANPLAKYEQYFNEMMNYTRNIYQKHSKTYDSENLRDFCDILIAAKHEAIADDKQSAQYFTDDNLLATLSDLFIAGVETSQSTFMWIMLFMAYYPDYQDKLHNEISHEIGDRVPVIEDKSLLNYTLAFVSEILRYKNPAPMGVLHKALVDSKLGEHPVPEGTSLLVHQSWIMMDPKHWSNPDKFQPERFLDEHGQYLQTKFAAYMPFSCGRRICPGETLAINDLFLILVNFLQLTKEYRIELHSEHGENTRDVIEPDLSTQALYFPKPYNIIFKRK